MRKHYQKTTALLLAAIALSAVATTIFNSPVIGQASTQQKQDLSQDRVGRMILGGQIDPASPLTVQQANLKLRDS